jgi:hypothetical protein
VVQEGDEDDDKLKAFDTKQLNLFLPIIAHLGFHVHPTTSPITKATHIGTGNTIVPVNTPTIFCISNNSYKASIKAAKAVQSNSSKNSKNEKKKKEKSPDNNGKEI